MLYLSCPKRFREFAWQVCEYLGLEEYDGEIDISTNSELEDGYGIAYGDTLQVDIELSNVMNRTIWHYRETIAHELVHARQFLKGELDNTYGNYGTTVYKGKAYGYGIPYKHQPWEQEAEQLEKEIMAFFFPEKFNV